MAHIDPGMVDLHQALSPDGRHLALITPSEEGLDLVLLAIPEGNLVKIATILEISSDELALEATGKKALSYYAITRYANLAWQPGEGRYLAFTGAINGSTSDLYLLDTKTGKIDQLTDGPSQAIQPSWSPDGNYIVHYGVNWVPPFGGAIVGHNRLDGVWAVRMSDQKVMSLPPPKGFLPHFLGWLDDTHYLTYDSDEACISRNLKAVDVENRKSVNLMSFSFDYAIAKAPDMPVYLFSASAGCTDSPGNGIYLLKDSSEVPVRVSDQKAYEIEWMPESGVFNAYPEMLISPDGGNVYLPPVYEKSFEPAISLLGFEAWEVIENQQGRVMVRIPGRDWRNILDGQVDELIWDPVTGNTLVIALADGTLYKASAPDFVPEQIGILDGGVNQAIWVQ
jgi:hypothetical protein